MLSASRRRFCQDMRHDLAREALDHLETLGLRYADIDVHDEVIDAELSIRTEPVDHFRRWADDEILLELVDGPRSADFGNLSIPHDSRAGEDIVEATEVGM